MAEALQTVELTIALDKVQAVGSYSSVIALVSAILARPSLDLRSISIDHVLRRNKIHKVGKLPSKFSGKFLDRRVRIESMHKHHG